MVKKMIGTFTQVAITNNKGLLRTFLQNTSRTTDPNKYIGMYNYCVFKKQDELADVVKEFMKWQTFSI